MRLFSGRFMRGWQCVFGFFLLKNKVIMMEGRGWLF